MPNTNAPFGFRALENQEGQSPTYGMTRWPISSGDANDFYTGDLVAFSSGIGGTITSYAGSSMAQAVLGVFAGCEFYNATFARNIWSPVWIHGTATGPVMAYVKSNPDMWFIAQVSSANFGSSSPTIGSSVIGFNVFYTPGSNGSGNAASGVSAATIMSTGGTTYTQLTSAPLRVVDVYSNYAPPGANGTDNSSAQFYQVLVVKPNNWALGGAGTVTQTT